MQPKNTKRNEKYHFTDVSNQCSVSFGSIITKVRKRHLALFKQNLYEKYTQKSKKCNFHKKMCMNILVTYHFGKLITCPIHWYIQNPAYLKIEYGFCLRVPCLIYEHNLANLSQITENTWFIAIIGDFLG